MTQPQQLLQPPQTATQQQAGGTPPGGFVLNINSTTNTSNMGNNNRNNNIGGINNNKTGTTTVRKSAENVITPVQSERASALAKHMNELLQRLNLESFQSMLAKCDKDPPQDQGAPPVPLQENKAKSRPCTRAKTPVLSETFAT